MQQSDDKEKIREYSLQFLELMNKRERKEIFLLECKGIFYCILAVLMFYLALYVCAYTFKVLLI